MDVTGFLLYINEAAYGEHGLRYTWLVVARTAVASCDPRSCSQVHATTSNLTHCIVPVDVTGVSIP